VDSFVISTVYFLGSISLTVSLLFLISQNQDGIVRDSSMDGNGGIRDGTTDKEGSAKQ